MKKLLGLIVFMVMLAASAQSAKADQLTSASDSLSNPKQAVASTHTFTFKPKTASNVRAVRFQFCTTASGQCNAPAGLVTSNATIGTVTGIAGTWALNKGVDYNIFVFAADGGAVSSSDTIVVPIDLITNSNMDACQAGGQASTDTCYVNITTYSNVDATTSPIDSTIVSYTTVAEVTVTARVDPTFTFVVSSVPANQVDNGITTSVPSDFNTLPFGNLTAGTPKYAAHRLNVTTNTQGGYTVDVLVQTQMTGVYGSNNIDAFIHPWTTPAAWTSPSGSTPNDNTGWFAANTTDGDVSANWAAAQGNARFAGLVLNTPANVMKSTTSDNGATAVYVTYAIEANVFQPADTYTGKLVYNALPTY